MIRLLFRRLLHQPSKTVLTSVALGGVIALLLVLSGFERGLDAQLRRIALDRNADLILAQVGTSNMTGARSVLPQPARAQAEGVPGVAAAHPLTGLSVIYDRDNRRTPVFVLVYDSVGGPQRLASAMPGPKDRGIILGEALALRYGLSLGDTFMISEFPFEVRGISKGSAALFTPFAFIQYDALIDFYLEAHLAEDISAFPLLSFLLVDLVPGSDREAVAGALEAAVPDADVHTPEELAANDARLGKAMFGSVLDLLESVGALIGMLVVAMLLFSSVAGRLRELAILKAVGFPRGMLFRLVLAEALILMAAAAPVGMFLAWAIARSIQAFEPLYLILPFEPASLARSLVLCVLFAMLGALLPACWVGRIDPARAFNP